MISIVDLFREKGWDPDTPGPECARATARPRILNRLSPKDARGCHFILVYLEYGRWFDRGVIDADVMHDALMKVGTYVVMGDMLPRVEWTEEGFLALLKELDHWNFYRLYPSRVRLWKAMEVHDAAYIWEHREEFEPAFTQGLIELDRDFVDAEGDRLRIARGMAMHEQDTLRPTQDVKPVSYADLAALFDFYTREGVDSVSSFDKDGVYRIDPFKVKTAADSHGRTGDSKEELLGDEILEKGEIDQALGFVAAADLTGQIREFITKEQSLTSPTSARWQVLKHFEELARRELTFRALMEMTGISRAALNEAFVAIRAELRRQYPEN